MLLARQTLDLVGLWLKEGNRTTLKDHLMEWSTKPPSPQDMANMIRSLHASITAEEDARQARRAKRKGDGGDGSR